MDPNKPPFNPYVRPKHTGTSPFRYNFNMGPQFVSASSRSLHGVQPGTSLRSLDPGAGSSVLSSIHNRPTGAIPKTNVGRNHQLRSREQKENRLDIPNRHRRREEPACLGIISEPIPRRRTPSPTVIFLPEPENGPTFHRNRLKSESTWLLERADSWDKIKTDVPDLPDWVVETIESVVGGIRLLVSSKFKQFRGLVELCASRFKIVSRIPIRAADPSPPSASDPPTAGTAEPCPAEKPVVVNPDDLDGFWDTMYLQVESLRRKLETLEKAKENNWREPQQVVPVEKKAAVKNPPKPAGRSKFREFLQKQKSQSQAPNPALLTSEKDLKEKPLSPKEQPFPPGPGEDMFGTPMSAVLRLSLDSGISDTPRNCRDTPMPSTPWESLLNIEEDPDYSVEVFADIKLSPLASPQPNWTKRDSLGGATCRGSMTPVALRNVKMALRYRRPASIGVIHRVSLMGKTLPEDDHPVQESNEE